MTDWLLAVFPDTRTAEQHALLPGEVRLVSVSRSGKPGYLCGPPIPVIDESDFHERTCREFREGRRPATPTERAAAYRAAAQTTRLMQPTPENTAVMLEQWAEVQDAIAEGQGSAIHMVGFHGRLGINQTPALRGPVYSDPSCAPIPYEAWETSTQISPSWPAVCGAQVLIVGEREVMIAAELRTLLDSPPRVDRFLRWLSTDSERCDVLRCARVGSMIAWYTSPGEIEHFRSSLAAYIRPAVLKAAREGSPDDLTLLSFWLSRAAVEDDDVILAAAGLRKSKFWLWRTVLDGVCAGSSRERIAAVERLDL